MELRHLVHAKSLADEGSFRVAAARLGLTQPALTKSIQALEAEVGVRLFDRSRKGIAPTAAGAALLRRAAGLLDGMADLQAELRAIRGGRLGKVRAGLGPVPAKLVLAPSMERFVREGMGVEISTEIGSASDLALKVARGELDFFIASLSGDSPIEGIETTLVGTMPLALLARRDHPLLAEAPPDPEALDRFPILGGRIPVASHRPIAAGGYRPLLACDDYDVIGRVALNSDALVVATPALTRMGWPYSELAPLPLPASWPDDRRVAQLYLATREGKTMSPAAAEVVAEFRRQLDAALV